MVTIGVYQSLSKNVMDAHRCLENIKTYKICWKGDNKQHYKAIIESDMVYTSE